ncbi:MAG: hypothetical protein AAF629_13610 [Chloroflexota bacterium]
MKHLSCFIFVSLLLLNFPAPISAQDPKPDTRFGIVQTYDDFDAAAASGAGFTRIKLYWDVIQPNGPDDWFPSNVPDPLLDVDLQAGREIVGLIVRTPAWARDLNNPGNDPDNPQAKDVPDLEAWATFVGMLVKQYEGRIHHWIIWNEPDVWDANHPGSTWNGTEEDYFQLLKTAYLEIKAVDPAMKVYISGFTYWWDKEYDREQYLSRLLAIILDAPDADKHDHYFDGIIYHLYYKPHQIFDILSEGQQTLDAFSLSDKEIWLNETNAPPSSDPTEPPHREPRFKATLTEQSAFMIQGHAMAFAAGADRVQVYKLFNSTEHPEDVQPFGLLRGDKSYRPAFATYQVVTTYMRDFESATRFVDGDVNVVVLDQGDKTTTIVWNVAPTPRIIRLNAISDEALIVDEAGNTEIIQPRQGQYQLELAAAECSSGACFIGGSPRLLVEQGPQSQRQPHSVRPTATPLPQTAFEILATSPRRRLVFGFDIILGFVVIGLLLWRFRSD